MSARSRTRQFFLRGLAIILPTVLTIWLVSVSYQFVANFIARPINAGVRWTTVHLSPWPDATDADFDQAFDALNKPQREMWAMQEAKLEQELGPHFPPELRITERHKWMRQQQPVNQLARQAALERWWQSIRIGRWAVMDLIGLIVAIGLIYAVGVLLSGFIGRRIYLRGEKLIDRVPLISRVYPAVKQVTDFFVGADNKKARFSRVVAVEYPRRGIWSVGLVTGETMRHIQNQAQADCLTVFIPSSPTPFTGYVITVPKAETIELPVSIEDALKFAVSLGVVVPSHQRILPTDELLKTANSATDSEDTENNRPD